MPENSSLAEQLKAALPESIAKDPACAEKIQALADLEARAGTLATERMFLERAPREGLMYPADALKLVDVSAKLREGEPTKALDALYAELRRDKPWLFAKQVSPANEKFVPGSNLELDRLRDAVKRGALSRDVQMFRPIKRLKK